MFYNHLTKTVFKRHDWFGDRPCHSIRLSGGIQWKIILADCIQWEPGGLHKTWHILSLKSQMPGFIKYLEFIMVLAKHFFQVSFMQCDKDSENGDNFLFVLDLKVTCSNQRNIYQFCAGDPTIGSGFCNSYHSDLSSIFDFRQI